MLAFKVRECLNCQSTIEYVLTKLYDTILEVTFFLVILPEPETTFFIFMHHVGFYSKVVTENKKIVDLQRKNPYIRFMISLTLKYL